MKKRKGITLVVVLAMMSILTAVVIMLWSSTNLSMLIAGNQRRQVQATSLASSGITHFTALNLTSSDRRCGDKGDQEPVYTLKEEAYK